MDQSNLNQGADSAEVGEVGVGVQYLSQGAEVGEVGVRVLYLSQGAEVGEVGVGVLLLGQQPLQLQHAGYVGMDRLQHLVVEDNMFFITR